MKASVAPTVRPDHEIAVIGAGLGGIGMGIALRRAGLDDFVILERAGDIGGTWRDNTYPGIAVDIPAQAYQFSYELKPDWSRVFAEGSEVKAYIDHCADGYDIRGLDDFAGTVLHSARWDHGIDLAGKKVAVIGTGASAVQIVPILASAVERLHVFQRTPIWVGPKFDPRTPRPLQRLYRRLPALQQVVRRAATRATEALLIDVVVNHQRMPFIAKTMAMLGRRVWYRSQVRDPDVRRALTPDYGVGRKRPSVSNSYLRSFNRPNVELVTEPIERVTAGGIRTGDGAERALDAIVLATGFRLASDPENFRRTPVRGRDGFDLADFYAEHRLASYEGSYPRAAEPLHDLRPLRLTGGTWHQVVETASTHIVRVIDEARRREATAVGGPTRGL